ncbi:ABC-type lipoprotein export system, ATPase component [Tessaracoccus bendigoensis DSM 12906]|uniref:ABC-type lipoprotein export system, ATPase component n=1 Tax=Tessaracoccus bendigoensis DSM 12906 TaxID=1123357 RepID=A0A1M6HRN0_9ACTN|nr:ABC transporter ATP-binding protein/permease [Tessaracoccus bendigoensis]SHJ24837.1 ABC-type lipoprotein export system, ATPase component [Tessaracoccus bendigoensis DSM 12906]
MLELRDVRKSYTTGDFTQVALDDVSIAFRDNEFVAILGPSGSGKTTLLNVVGGLDHYDSGNLIIDGVETSRYKDRDWDTYRNNRIGFVFQSYNLIPHQSVLANVELALTLAGVSPAERKRRALEALDEVGLSDHVHKRPNQLSGGQMQRVAIARALVNDPEILLADEPTGALDSATSVQIMALLTSIASDRLVIMVTHNPELAEQYATRIVSLRDGVISEDTDPFVPVASPVATGAAARHTSMSFLTAIALSFNNLMTKKGRTLMTSFAGSIGIIGIAAILALANGVNAYIKNVEEDTLSLYPLTIQRQGMDMTAMLSASAGLMEEASGNGAVEGDVHEVQVMGKMFSSVGTNDLESLKAFLESGESGIDAHVNSIQYAYDVTPQIYAADTSEKVRKVNPDSTFSALGFGSSASASSLVSSSMSAGVFRELMPDLSLVESHFDVMAGHWPTSYDETLLVLTPSGGVSDLALYAMGLRDPAELDSMVEQVRNEEDVESPTDPLSLSYDDLMGASFKLVDESELYTHDDEFGVWTDRSGDAAYLKKVVDGGADLRVAGIVKPTEDSARLSPGIYYTRALTEHIVAQADASPIVQQQLADPAVNVFTGRGFGEEPDDSEFDFASLFTIDEDAIAKAFTFDESKLNLDLSGLESGLSGADLGLSDLELDPSKLPALDLDQILAGLDLSSLIKIPDGAPTPDAQAPDVDADDLTEAATKLVEGYFAFAAAGGLDPADVASNLPAFLETPEAAAALDEAGIDGASVTKLVEGYVSFAVAGGLDPTDVATNLPAFFASAEGSALLGEIAPLPGADAGLVERLVSGYLAFAVENGLDPTDAAASFPAFLASPAGQALAGEVVGYLDTSSLETQLQGVLGDYLQQVMTAYMGEVSGQLTSALTTQISSALESSMGQLADNMSDAMGIDQDAFLAAFKMERSKDELTQLLVSMASTQSASYEGNLRTLGWADFDNPSRIDIYPIDFESKAEVTGILDGYNDSMRAEGQEGRVITYTDLVGALMSSVTDIINMISYVLIAFVAISLVVSSIMIGVITYISVLERKKEIGILRSIGASKKDIRRVFNAETLIVGFVAGALGVIITFLLTIPANAIVYANFDVPNIARLPWQAAGILVLISMALTALAGLIPSSAASRKDPVEALRSE